MSALPFKTSRTHRRQKAGDLFHNNISKIRAKVSFAILRSALLCVRGSRAKRRRSADDKERDLEIDKESAGLD